MAGKESALNICRRRDMFCKQCMEMNLQRGYTARALCE